MFKQSNFNQFIYILKRIKDRTSKKYSLVIDGETLLAIFQSDLDMVFREVCLACDAVLCCRLSPAQKASVNLI